MPITPLIINTVKLDEFILRITALRNKALSSAQIDLSVVDGAIIMLTNGILIRTYNDILTEHQKPDHGYFSQIKPGVHKYIKRPNTEKQVYLNNSRTYAIICEADGTLKLIIETKSKDLNNEKLNIKWRQGGFWRCKVGFRIDVELFIPIASSVKRTDKAGSTNKVLGSKQLTELQQSIAYNNQMAALDPDHFINIDCVMDDNMGTHLYTEHMEWDFSDIIFKDVLYSSYATNERPILDRTMIQFGNKNIETCKLDVIYQLITAVTNMHSVGLAHQDLKSKNIVCAYNALQKRLIIKIIDFGFAKRFETNKITRAGTYSYLPYESFVHFFKEVEAAHGADRAKNFFVLMQEENAKKYSEPLYGLDLLLQKINNNENIVESSNENYNGKHDIWSLGLIIFEILCGGLPQINDEVTKSALALLNTTIIGKMLSIDPTQRPTMQEVLDFANQSPLFATVNKLSLGSLSNNAQIITMSPESRGIINAMNNINITLDAIAIAELLNQTENYFNASSIRSIKMIKVHVLNTKNALLEIIQNGLSNIIIANFNTAKDNVYFLFGSTIQYTETPKSQEELVSTQEEKLIKTILLGITNLIALQINKNNTEVIATELQNLHQNIKQTIFSIDYCKNYSYESRFGVKTDSTTKSSQHRKF